MYTNSTSPTTNSPTTTSTTDQTTTIDYYPDPDSHTHVHAAMQAVFDSDESEHTYSNDTHDSNSYYSECHDNSSALIFKPRCDENKLLPSRLRSSIAESKRTPFPLSPPIPFYP